MMELSSSKNSGLKSEPVRPHFSIEWRQLTYYHGAPSRALLRWRQPQEASAKLTLDSLDGRFRSGQLSAILGPSGAGKSTFLSALFGNKQESAYGRTCVNWFEDAQHSRSLEAGAKRRPIRTAFLPQHDHLLGHLSVHETLMFASKIKNATKLGQLRLGPSERDQFHKRNVRRVVKMLKLAECLQTRCNRLSGGQHKRVSIGQELLSEPDVIILDEPTSGLDALTCLTTVRTLKSIVLEHPISIILTIHQPELDVFNLFDHIYVIAQGGRAIYEGAPSGLVPSLALAGLRMPAANYNPARFVIENAFIVPPDSGEQLRAGEDESGAASIYESPCSSSDSEHDEADERPASEARQVQAPHAGKRLAASALGQSLLSLTASALKRPARERSVLASGLKAAHRSSGRKPLLNIGGVKTCEGELITSGQLGLGPGADLAASSLERLDFEQSKLERVCLLKRLNEIQKSRYYAPALPAEQTRCPSGASQSRDSSSSSSSSSDISSEISSGSASARADLRGSPSGRDEASIGAEQPGGSSSELLAIQTERQAREQAVAGAHLISIEASPTAERDQSEAGQLNAVGPPSSSAKSSGLGSTISRARSWASGSCTSSSLRTTSTLSSGSHWPSGPERARKPAKLRRHFDKQLNAKHSNSKQREYPIYQHAHLLTHRTWLSIVRDPVFFGIQFCMHTTIPLLLAFIFGSHQEEGCPRLGHFDLVQFAYEPDSSEFIRNNMLAIRQSIGNTGVVFFEMFVLSFAINCITALVFPLDMHVLLKEYRNGWYSLRSYFIGRTLADLPVPVLLHSLAMSILYYLTGQPREWWRFAALIFIVIIASLVAQSVGLTIGALLMRSSQSAVLAAAGIVAPFFALSGFIVRIHTLPALAQWAAQASYLYHLLNGFIVLRYGFGRCACEPADFEAPSEQHEIPKNLRTMASIWIGTYSDEFAGSLQRPNATKLERAPLDPNIDLIEKLASAFRMANSYGHKVDSCQEALPYAMLDFNLHDWDIWACCSALIAMLLVTRLITFGAIYFKVRSFT